MNCVDSILEWRIGRGYRFGGNIGDIVRYNKNTKNVIINITSECPVNGMKVRLYAYQNEGDSPIMFERTIADNKIQFPLEGNITYGYGKWIIETVLMGTDEKYADVAKITYNVVRTADGDGVTPIPPTETGNNVDELVKKLDDKIVEANDKLTDISGKVTEADVAVGKINTAVASINDAVVKADGKIQDINTAITNADTKIADVNTAMTSADSKIADVNTALKNADDKIVEVNTNTSDAVDKADEKIKELNDIVAGAKISGGGTGGASQWFGTQAEYDNIKLKKSNSVYNLVNEADDSVTEKYKIMRSPLSYYDPSLFMVLQNNGGTLEHFTVLGNDRFNNRIDTADRFKNLEEWVIDDNDMYKWYIDTNDRNPETAFDKSNSFNVVCYKKSPYMYIGTKFQNYTDNDTTIYTINPDITVVEADDYFLVKGTLSSETEICRTTGFNITESTRTTSLIEVENNNGNANMKLYIDGGNTSTSINSTNKKQDVVISSYVQSGYKYLHIDGNIGDSIDIKIYKNPSVAKAYEAYPFFNGIHPQGRLKFYMDKNANQFSVIVKGCRRLSYGRNWTILEGQTYNDSITLNTSSIPKDEVYDFIITNTFVKAYDSTGKEYDLIKEGSWNTRTIAFVSAFVSNATDYITQILIYDGDLGETKAKAELAKTYLMGSEFVNR